VVDNLGLAKVHSIRMVSIALILESRKCSKASGGKAAGEAHLDATKGKL